MKQKIEMPPLFLQNLAPNKTEITDYATSANIAAKYNGVLSFGPGKSKLVPGNTARSTTSSKASKQESKRYHPAISEEDDELE